MDTVCTIKTASLQLNPTDPGTLAKESTKDPLITNVMHYTRGGYPPKDVSNGSLQVVRFSLHNPWLPSTCIRIKSGDSLKSQAPNTATSSFGTFWDAANEVISEHCSILARDGCRDNGPLPSVYFLCQTHQKKPPKAANHPWKLPEKPWSHVHLDHAINFLGSNWLILIDTYSKYPSIHPTTSTSTKSTMELLEQDFAHFGYPHTIVLDNATSFSSEEFQAWCRERGIIHLTGAPYHPVTNGAAESLVQTFRQALTKSSLPPQAVLQEFLMQYRRTPRAEGQVNC